MRTRLAIVVAALAVLGSTLTGPAAVAMKPDRERQTVYFDMFYQANVHPKRIFLTANSGPWLKGLKWKNWGSKRTVAHGRYISNCASCPPPKRREATVTFTRPVACRGEFKGYVAYRRGIVKLSAPDEGRTKTKFALAMGCP